MAMPTATRQRPSATRTAFGELEIRTSYSERTLVFVNDLKESISARDRRPDTDEKVWRVMGALAESAISFPMTGSASEPMCCRVPISTLIKTRSPKQVGAHGPAVRA